MDSHETLDQIGVRYIEGFDTCKGKHYKGGDKTSIGHYFTKRYEELFSGLCETEVNFLELGVLNGRSLAMWSDYFPKGQIFGVDVCLSRFNKSKEGLEKLGAFKNGNVQVYEEDVTKLEEFSKLIESLPFFDVVIDDALHQSKAQYNNFLILFPRLNPGGIYVIEDIIKPEGFVLHFKDILAGVSSQNSKFAKNNKLYPIINKIESIEIRSNNIIIKKR